MTLPYFDKACPTLFRHPLNDWSQIQVVESYAKGVLKQGVQTAARGSPMVMKQTRNNNCYYRMSNATLTEVVYLCVKRDPIIAR